MGRTPGSKNKPKVAAMSLKQPLLTRLEEALTEHDGYKGEKFDTVWMNRRDYHELHTVRDVNAGVLTGAEVLNVINMRGYKLNIELIAEANALSFVGVGKYHEYVASPKEKMAIAAMPEYMRQIYF